MLQFFCTVFQSLFPAIISTGEENVWRNLPQICFSTKFPWPIYFIILSHKGLCWPLYVLKGHMQLGSPRKVSWLVESIVYKVHKSTSDIFEKNSEIHSKYKSQDLTWSRPPPHPHGLVNNMPIMNTPTGNINQVTFWFMTCENIN